MVLLMYLTTVHSTAGGKLPRCLMRNGAVTKAELSAVNAEHVNVHPAGTLDYGGLPKGDRYIAKDGAAAARSTIKSGLDRGERHPRKIVSAGPCQLPRAECASTAVRAADTTPKARFLWSIRQPFDGRYLRGARRHGVDYHWSEKGKSDIYRECLPLRTTKRVELVEHPRLKAQLTGLCRWAMRGGNERIDHPVGGHDDIANAVAGALVRACGEGSMFAMWARLAS